MPQSTSPAGQNFSTKVGSDGVINKFTVITSLGAEGSVTGTDLQGMNGQQELRPRQQYRRFGNRWMEQRRRLHAGWEFNRRIQRYI